MLRRLIRNTLIYLIRAFCRGGARRCREVVKLCEINREFLRNVLCARDPRYKRILIQKAREICRKMGGE